MKRKEQESKKNEILRQKKIDKQKRLEEQRKMRRIEKEKKKDQDLKTIQEEEQNRLDEIRRIEIEKKRKQQDKEKYKMLGLKKKGDTSSSSVIEDEFPDDLPSSERQRHMNPINFVNRAEELVMQQILGNANVDFSKQKEPPGKQKKEETKAQTKSKAKEMYSGPKVTRNEINFDTQYSKKNRK